MALIVSAADVKATQVWLACNPGIDRLVFNKLKEAVDSVLEEGSAATIATRYR